MLRPRRRFLPQHQHPHQHPLQHQYRLQHRLQHLRQGFSDVTKRVHLVLRFAMVMEKFAVALVFITVMVDTMIVTNAAPEIIIQNAEKKLVDTIVPNLLDIVNVDVFPLTAV